MKTLVLIFLSVLSSFGLKAQYSKDQSPEQRAKGNVSILKGMLNLTNQQTEKVLQIYTNHYKSTDSLKTIIVNRGPNPEAINSNLTTMIIAKQLEADKKISLILNHDQQSTFAKFVSSRKPGYVKSVTSAPFR